VRSAPRARALGREDEEESSPDETSSLADALASAVSEGDATAALGLLETLVVRRGGGAAGLDGASPIEELAPAGAAAYRDAAPVSLLRALGVDGVAHHLVHLLRNAESVGHAEGATQALSAYVREHEALSRAVGARILAREPWLLPHLPALAPELARADRDELRALLDAPTEALVRALPRIAHATLPTLARKKRNGLSPLVHRIAALDDPHAPAALQALARAGIPVDRKLRGKVPIEVAAEAGALANLRALEDAGARRPAPPRPKTQPGPSRGKRAKPSPPEPAKPWWESDVGPSHIATLVGFVALLCLGLARGGALRTVSLLGLALLIAAGWVAFYIKGRSRSRSRWG
jgi:hypothetical protein